MRIRYQTSCILDPEPDLFNLIYKVSGLRRSPRAQGYQQMYKRLMGFHFSGS